MALGRSKWYPALTTMESRLLAAIPKAVLFVVARQLAALALGECDNLGSPAFNKLCEEWEAQYLAGNVPQKPPKGLRASEF